MIGHFSERLPYLICFGGGVGGGVKNTTIIKV